MKFSALMVMMRHSATHCVGYGQLADYIRGANDGIAKTPDWASSITGIPAARIAQLAQQLIGVRSFMTCSYSVQRAHRGEQPYWMVIALSAMLGQVGLPGGVFIRSWFDEWCG